MPNTYLSWPRGVVQYVTAQALEWLEAELKKNAHDRDMAHAKLLAKGRC